jgi:protease-4
MTRKWWLVVLRINSPGGSAVASQEVGVEVNRLKEAGKKVLVSMWRCAASGGYWIAAVLIRLWPIPPHMTGSLGVIMEMQNYQGLMDKLGLKSDPIKSGPHKDIGSPTRPRLPRKNAAFSRRWLMTSMISSLMWWLKDGRPN